MCSNLVYSKAKQFLTGEITYAVVLWMKVHTPAREEEKGGGGGERERGKEGDRNREKRDRTGEKGRERA